MAARKKVEPKEKLISHVHFNEGDWVKYSNPKSKDSGKVEGEVISVEERIQRDKDGNYKGTIFMVSFMDRLEPPGHQNIFTVNAAYLIRCPRKSDAELAAIHEPKITKWYETLLARPWHDHSTTEGRLKK